MSVVYGITQHESRGKQLCDTLFGTMILQDSAVGLYLPFPGSSTYNEWDQISEGVDTLSSSVFQNLKLFDMGLI